MEILRNPDEKIICPYNTAHHIRKMRMEVHLKKCRIAHKESKVLVPCDFNACHCIPEPELQYHHSVCPDKKEIELQVLTEDSALPTVVAPMPTVAVPVDNSWDDCDVPSYNAEKYCLENQILRRLDTESAAKRRDFRVSERLRHGHISSEAPEYSQESQKKKCQNKKDNLQNLPPTPSFATSTIETTPDDITNLLIRNLNTIPKAAVIPKSKK